MLSSSMGMLRLALSKPTYRGIQALCQLQSKAEIHTSSLQSAKKGLPFEYVEPVKEPFNFRKWDLENLKQVDLKEPRLAFKHSDELKSDTCSEAARKIVSLEFASHTDVISEIKLRYMASVQRHALDTGSFESTIAALTVKIRNLQIHVKKHPRNRAHGVYLKEAIDKRNKHLNTLRSKDHPRFEWLVNELKIVYKIPARFHYTTDRRKTIREMTQNYCENIRIEKISAVREKLRAQQTDFLKEKEEKLRFIAEEEKALGLASETESTQPSDDSSHNLPPPVASNLLQVARTAEGPYTEPPYVKKRKSS